MTQQIKNVVLVHGAFADGSGWEPVAIILKNDGYKVSVAQPPETSYAEDIKYTKAAVDAMDGPVVLVGHSYGGGGPPARGRAPRGVVAGAPVRPRPQGRRGRAEGQLRNPAALTSADGVCAGAADRHT